MSETTAVAVVRLLVLALTGAAFWFAVWRGLRSTFTAEFRADLFELRRQLFWLVASGRIAPTARAYVRVRGLLNGLLNQAEMITPATVIVLMAIDSMHAAETKGLVNLTASAISEVSDADLRSELKAIHDGVGKAIIAQLQRFVWLSPVFWIVIPTVAAKNLWSRVAQTIEAPATPIETAFA